MRIPFAKPVIAIGDIETIHDFLMDCDGQLTQGPKVKQFEKDFGFYIDRTSDGLIDSHLLVMCDSEYELIHNSYCIATSSCMGALHLAYLTLGIGPGDEVIVPAMTHVATAHAVELVGAKPIFIDCENNGNINPKLIEKELCINRNIKAISVVHYLGNCCRMGTINYLAEKYGVKVIEDCALSLGSRLEGKHVGLLSDFGAFSFYPSKHITTGEGGMLVTTDYTKYKRAKAIASFGKTSGDNADYDIGFIGSNFRMSEIQAVLGIQQLKRVNDYLSIRERNLKRWYIFINDLNNGAILSNMFTLYGGTYSALFRCIDKNKRDNIRKALLEKGVQTSIYYPKPVPAMSYYRNKYGYAPARYQEAIDIADTTLALPIGPHITGEDMEYIIESLRNIL